jgi:cbb3-type cytochrome c oxidase subunit III
MKMIGIRLAAVLAIALPAAGAMARDVDRHGLQAKISYCKTCHGASGEGFRGFYTAPRLAGQTPLYIENQLRAMAKHTRDNPAARMFMTPVAANLDGETRKALAKYFSSERAAPSGGGPRNLAADGQKIFEDGVPDANVPACAACHGPDAKGSETVPRLAGQIYSYTAGQLMDWKIGLRAKDPETGEANTMTPIAGSMSSAQIKAVAAYLSHLK